MYHFDRDDFLREGEQVYGLRTQIEEIADAVCKTGFDNIILTGVGGTTADLTIAAKMLEQYSDIEVHLLNAAEALATQSKYLTGRSLVISASKSGDTKETVAVCGYARDIGAQVVVFLSRPDTPLGKIANYAVVSKDSRIESALLKFYLLTGRILFNCGHFQEYPLFAGEMKNLHRAMLTCKEKFEPTADRLAKQYWNEPYQLWIASDINYGMAYLFTMCILEEMQWMRTKLVSSPEFFHGTLELVDKDMLVYLVKGIGPCRILDERVEKFLQGKTDKLYVFDLQDYPLEGISSQFHYLVSPILFAALTRGRLCEHLEKYSGHDLNYRRYYRQFNY